MISSAFCAGQTGLEFADLDIRIDGRDGLGGRVQFLSADIVRGVDDLALQICEINNIEIDNTERSDARGGQIHGDGRAQSAGADAEHLRLLQLELPFHADLGQDEVARVAQDLVVGESGGLCHCTSCHRSSHHGGTETRSSFRSSRRDSCDRSSLQPRATALALKRCRAEAVSVKRLQSCRHKAAAS